MRIFLAAFCALVMLGSGIGQAGASSISVSPTTVELTAPAGASQITLRNTSGETVFVQTRVFKWSQADGKERLEPTKNVVASPPTIKLERGQEYVVRVVRVSKAPVQGEESYRLLVDELPKKSDTAANHINMVLRQSIPLFFTQKDSSAPQMSWQISSVKGRSVLTGTNSGATHLKLSRMTLEQNGKKVAAINGLVGYVLGGSTMSFPLPRKVPAGKLSMSASSNAGKFTTSVQGR